MNETKLTLTIILLFGLITISCNLKKTTPRGEFFDNFEDGNLREYRVAGIEITHNGLISNYSAERSRSGFGYAYNPNLVLKNKVGEVSIVFTIESDETRPGVGFLSGDGTRVYLVADPGEHEMRVERRIKNYSIFDVIPKGDQKPSWKERRDIDSFYIWEVESVLIGGMSTGKQYRLKLYFSRASKCIMGILQEVSSDSVLGRVRTIVDVAPENPFFFSDGPAIFDNFYFKSPLDDWVYSWMPIPHRDNPSPGESPSDPVLVPNENYSWQYPFGLANPEVWRENREFYAVYRSFNLDNPGQVRYHGLALSNDGIHWATDSVKIAYGEDPVIVHRPFGGNKHYVLQPSNIIKDKYQGVNFVQAGDEVPYGNASKEVIDTEKYPQLDRVTYNGESYRFIKFVEKYGGNHAGYVAFSKDLKHWKGPKEELLPPQEDGWANLGRPIGAAFVQPDGDIRVFYTACTDEGYVNGDEAGIASAVVDGKKPWQVIKESEIGLPFFPIYPGKKGGGNDSRRVEFDLAHWDDGPQFPGSLVMISEENKVFFYYGANDQYTGLAVATIEGKR